MANFYTHQRKNKAKTWILMFCFFMVVIALGWFLSYYYQSPHLLYIALGFSLVMNIWAYWFSHKTVIAMTQAREVSRDEHRELHRLVENLSITAGLPKPKIYIIDDPSPNAFATGRNKEHAVVAVTTGLLDILDENELQGVIAHELAHIGNQDMLLSTVAVVLVGVITFVSDMLLRATIFSGGDSRKGGLAALIGALVIAIVMPLAATALRMAISRKREYLADATAVRLTRYPEGLASALEKIHRFGATMKKSNHATAHLFIANPFRSQKKSNIVDRLFKTHPPAEQRIKRLREMDGRTFASSLGN
jgi:heat shock protein HtpX